MIDAAPLSLLGKHDPHTRDQNKQVPQFVRPLQESITSMCIIVVIDSRCSLLQTAQLVFEER
jgi:hypothetical protein